MSMFVHVRVEQEGNLTRYLNLRICKLQLINCNFVADYWDTAFVHIFVTNVSAASGYGWSLPLTAIFIKHLYNVDIGDGVVLLC